MVATYNSTLPYCDRLPPPSCTPCMFGARTSILTPPYHFETATLTVVPYVTVLPGGSSSTYSYSTVTAPSAAGNADVPGGGVVDEPTWTVDGATLTYPTTYAQFFDFSGAAPSPTHYHDSCPALTLEPIALPATTDPASLIVPSPAAGLEPGTLPPTILQYMAGLSTVEQQLQGIPLSSCQPTYATDFPTPCITLSTSTSTSCYTLSNSTSCATITSTITSTTGLATPAATSAASSSAAAITKQTRTLLTTSYESPHVVGPGYHAQSPVPGNSPPGSSQPTRLPDQHSSPVGPSNPPPSHQPGNSGPPPSSGGQSPSQPDNNNPPPNQGHGSSPDGPDNAPASVVTSFHGIPLTYYHNGSPTQAGQMGNPPAPTPIVTMANGVETTYTPPASIITTSSGTVMTFYPASSSPSDGKDDLKPLVITTDGVAVTYNPSSPAGGYVTPTPIVTTSDGKAVTIAPPMPIVTSTDGGEVTYYPSGTPDIGCYIMGGMGGCTTSGSAHQSSGAGPTSTANAQQGGAAHTATDAMPRGSYLVMGAIALLALL